MSGYSRWATIYRPAYGDCSNGGPSGRLTSIAVAGTKLADPEWDNPERLTDGPNDEPIYDVKTKMGDYRYLEPRVQPEGMCGPMASGNYAYVDGVLLPIHDRFETWEQYEALSR